MAVGAHVELSPLAEAVPDSFCDDSSEASDIVVSGPVSTACEAADADGKMDARHAAAAMAAEGTTSEQLRHEAARCVALGGPISLQYIFGFGSSVISLIFVGHLGTFEMSAAVLGTSFSNVSGFALMAGLSSALETLCGQAYGARHYEMVGVSLQRGLLICLTAFLVLLPVWLNFEPLMIAMGQQPDLAAGASRYLRLSIPSIFFQGAFSCVSKYLTAQSIVNPQTYCTTATIVLSPLFNWLLIYQSGLGLDGAAIANVLVTMVEAVMLLGFMVHREQRSARSSESTWHGWSLQAFTGWWGYLCLAAPSAAMVVVEWSTFEIMVLLAGLLPNPELATATMGWLLNICTIVYLLPLALSGAASTRVSNALGANRPSAARIAALTAVLLTMVVTGSLAVAVLATRRQLGHIFSTDAAVIALGASVLPIISCAFVGDGVNAALGGVVRGAGRQTVGAATNFVSYWLLGLPLAALLAFRLRLGVHGLWLGLLTGTSFQAVTLGFIVSRFSWAAEARQAAVRVAAGKAAARPADEEEADALLPAWRGSVDVVSATGCGAA